MAILQTLGGKAGSLIRQTLDPITGVLKSTTGWTPPELNISESLESWGGSQPGSPFVWVKPAYDAEQPPQETPPQQPPQETSPQQPPSVRPPVINRTAGDGGGGGGGVFNQDIYNRYYPGWGYEAARQDWIATGGAKAFGGGGGGGGGPSLTDLIEQAYQSTLSALSEVEQRNRQSALEATSRLKGEAQTLREQTEQQRGLRRAELGTRREQVGLDVQSATTRVKQMMADLQNKAAAFLASRGGGAWASSLGAAVSEKLARTGLGQIGELETQRIGALNAIRDEAARVEQFYDEKRSQIDQQLQEALGQIEAQLKNSLDNISMAKGEAARAKAQQTMEAWNNYANSRAQLAMQALNLQQAITQWALDKGQTLQQALNYAIANTPTINPAAFGIASPIEPTQTGLVEPTGLLSYVPQSGVAVKARKQGEEDNLYPYLQTFK